MTKQELIEENNKLLEKVEKLEKEVNNNFLVNDNRVLYEVNTLLKENLYFYQEILRNMSKKEGDQNEQY